MCKPYIGRALTVLALWIVLLLAFTLFKPAIGFSKTAPKRLIRSALVTIGGKTTDAVLVGERRFLVTETTTIVMPEGGKIELAALPVPCEAEIKYQLRMDEDPVTLKIRVKRVLSGAQTSWPPRGAER
jgi:hypothetical protein